jgi:hypothetical protein
MLLEKRPYFITGSTRLLIANQKNPLYSLLNSYQLATIYKEGWLKQLFDLKSTKWYAKPELTRVCPSDLIITPLFGNGAINLGVVREKDYLHPVITTLTQFRRNIKMNANAFSRGWSANNEKSIPTAALSLLLNINAFDIDINYYLRKKGFRLLIAMIKLIDRTQYKNDKQNKKWQEIQNRECMEREDQLSKAVAKKQAVIAAKQEKAVAKATKKQAVIAAKQEKAVAKATKKQAVIAAKQEKAVAKATKKQAVIAAKQEKAVAKAAKAAKKQAVTLEKQDKAEKERVIQQRRYKLNIIA